MNSMEYYLTSYGDQPNFLFTDVWDSYEAFSADVAKLPFPLEMEEEYLSLAFYLLYAEYGNNTIAPFDVNRFKFKLFGIMKSFGPTWQKKNQLQKQIRELSAEEIAQGAKHIYNSALNPGTDPTTASLEELNYINAQNTTNIKRSKIEALTTQYGYLEDRLNAEFIDRFRSLFIKVLTGRSPLYVTEG